jgi:hypothetical protein
MFQKMRSGGSRVSHAALALGHLTEKPEVIESLWKVTRNPLNKYDGQEIIILRKKDLTLGQRNEIALKCVSVEQQSYGILKIPLYGLDALFKTYWFSKNLGLSNFKVCSNLIAWSYEKVLGKQVFGVPWRCVTPDVIDDFCDHNPEWEEVYNSLKD